MNVRPAKPEDTEWILEELRKFSDFLGTKYSVFDDEEFARAGIAGMIEKHLFLVAEEIGGHPVGFIGGYVFNHPLNPSIRVLAESFWWVDEQWRKSRAGYLLLKNFIDWGKKRVHWVTMALETKSPVKDKTLEKLGFRLNERAFLMEI